MAVTLEQFAKYMVDSGIFTREEVQEFLAGLPEESRPQDGEQLARELVRRKKLTSFQASALYQGHPEELVLGNYVILDKLGQGGMGVVLKAQHRRMKRVVALKVLSPAVTNSPAARQRFQREVEAAARLEHPHIVTAHDADEAKGVHFLVMQFVEGADLASIVKKQGPLPVDKAVDCIRQATQGLEYAHARGVIHRDIKPANLLLDKQGQVKVLDMGLARIEEGAEACDLAGGAAGLTNTGAVMGTVDFMSPEQAFNAKEADQRADVYSLGITLFYLLTGRAVYFGRSLMEILLAHREAPIPLLRSARPDIPRELDAVFQKMVAKQPADRYQSMTEVLRALEACMARPSYAALPASSGFAPDALGEDTALQQFFAGVERSQSPPRQRGETEPNYDTIASDGITPPPAASGPAALRHSRARIWIGSGLVALALVAALSWSLAGNRSREKTRADEAAVPKGPVVPAAAVGEAAAPAWPPGPADGVLPGVVPRPAVLAGIKRWQVDTNAPREEMLSVAWSKQGLIACGTNSGTIRVYDATNLRLARLLAGHNRPVHNLSWSPDGERLISSQRFGSPRLWSADGTSGPVIEEPHWSRLNYVAFAWSPTGDRLASYGSDGALRLSTKEGVFLETLQQSQLGPDRPCAIAWSANGKSLAVSDDKIVRILHLEGTVGPVLRGHESSIASLSWRPDGSQIATASTDKTVRIWNADGTPGPVLKDHESSISCVAWSPDGRHLASGDLGGNGGGVIRVWASNGELLATCRGHRDESVRGIAWSPDGQQLASVGSDHTLRLWNRDGTPGPAQGFGTVLFQPLAWNPNGQELAAGYYDGTVRLWKATGAAGRVIRARERPVCALTWDSDGKQLTVGGQPEEPIRIWSRNGSALATLAGPVATVECLAWSPGGSQLAAGTMDGLVHLWKSDNSYAKSLKGHSGEVQCLAWSHDGKWLATGADDTTIRLWRANGEPGPILTGHTQGVKGLSWSPDDQQLASSSQDYTGRIWSVGGQLQTELQLDGDIGRNWLDGIGWSPDGNWIAAGTWDRNVHFWKPDGTPGPVLKGHSAPVVSLEWNRSGERFATGSTDTAVMVWNGKTLEPEWVSVSFSDGSSATFTAAGEVLDGKAATLEQELVYLVEQADGRIEVLKPSEFQARLLPPDKPAAAP